MIKTLRITGAAVAILAVCSLVFSVVLGLADDDDKVRFLAKPGVVEQFKANSGKPAKKESQTSPLVKQAQAFALRINPPKPKKISLPTARNETKLRPKKVSVKFPLLGTCYHPSRPEKSIALIDLPAKGPRWVRQGDEVGHLVIEQIESKFIVIRDGERTSELAIEERPKGTNLIKGSSDQDKSGAENRTDKRKTVVPTSPESQTKRRIRRSVNVPLKNEAEEIQANMDFLKMLISDEEAEQLGDLGSMLNDLKEDSLKIEGQQKKQDTEPNKSEDR